jgi:Tol biopolymer transport system component
MTSPRRFEQDMPALLADTYLAGIPDYRDDLVQQVARVRQRPAWTFPGRWLPMDLVTTRVPTTRIPWRQIGVLALLALLLAAALAIYAGSQQTRLPAPFGPAGNGLIAYAADGDIFTADPVSGVTTAIVASPETDVGPRFSRDGTRILFEREVADGSQLYVVKPDGSGLTLLTPAPMTLTESELGEPWEQYQFSPDGRSVLIAESGGLVLAASDGSGSPIRIQTGMTVTEPSFRPPDGREILFVGRLVGANHGLFAVDPSSGDVRTIFQAPLGFDLAGANWSPDGSRIAYWMWGGPGSEGGVTARTHIISADGTGDRLLDVPPGAFWMMGSDWSNDGTRLFLLRGYSIGIDAARPAIVPADGSSLGVEIPYPGSIIGECCGYFEWAPDDSVILGRSADESGRPDQQIIIDPEALTYRTAPWTSTSDPAWQRRAP